MEKDIKDLMKTVYKEGFNIYALLNKFKKEMMYELPDSVIEVVCKEYLKQKPVINNDWAWFVRVLRAKRDEAFAGKQIKEHEAVKYDTNSLLLKNLFGGKK
jgi:hypothetical protein